MAAVEQTRGVYVSVDHSKANQSTEWEVFGRAKSTDSLAHIGVVKAEGARLAKARARMIYSEKPWVELCIVPRACVHTVVARGTSERIGFA